MLFGAGQNVEVVTERYRCPLCHDAQQGLYDGVPKVQMSRVPGVCHSLERAVLLEQLRGGPKLHDSPVVNDGHLVGTGQNVELVAEHDRRPLCHNALQGLHDEPF